MITLSASVCIDASPAAVWAALSNLEGIHLWTDVIHHSYCIGEHTRGVGAVRVCELRGDVRLEERMIEWTEGRSLAYVGEGLPLVRRAVNRWSISPEEGRTLLTTVSEVELKGGWLGRLGEPLLRIVSARMARRSLSLFKHLVEHGSVPARSHRLRLPSPVAC